MHSFAFFILGLFVGGILSYAFRGKEQYAASEVTSEIKAEVKKL